MAWKRAGLIERKRPALDRRVIEIVMTQAGQKALTNARSVHRRGINEHSLST
jgi:DNA-binding MarR family transcriptional regulator